jgi:hypothetical protein
MSAWYLIHQAILEIMQISHRRPFQVSVPVRKQTPPLKYSTLTHEQAPTA